MSKHKYNEAYSKGYSDGQKAQCLADTLDDAIQMLGKLKNITNGDIIKVILKPYILQISEDYELNKKVRVAIGVRTPILEFDINWWNAPYKGE